MKKSSLIKSYSAAIGSLGNIAVSSYTRRFLNNFLNLPPISYETCIKLYNICFRVYSLLLIKNTMQSDEDIN